MLKPDTDSYQWIFRWKRWPKINLGPHCRTQEVKSVWSASGNELFKLEHEVQRESLRVFDASSIRQGRLVKKYLWKKCRNVFQTALWPLKNIFRTANACAEIIMELLINQQKLEQSAAYSLFVRLHTHAGLLHISVVPTSLSTIMSCNENHVLSFSSERLLSVF